MTRGVKTRKEVASTIIRKYAEGVWQGVVQSGVGSFDADAADRAHIRYVGAFDLRSWGGTPIPREINIHMVAKYSLNDGATWTTCGDTGWKSSGSPRSEFSVEFYKLASSCPEIPACIRERGSSRHRGRGGQAAGS